MALMNEAMSKEDFERMEKGLPRLKPKRVDKPDPALPTIENEIKAADIPGGYEIHLESAKRHIMRNEEGVRFIGFNVVIELFPIRQKRKPGRPKESESVELEPMTLTGWMLEGQFLEFVRTYRKQIDQQVIRW